MKCIAGLDVGNGYVKGKFRFDKAAPVLVDLPSTVSYTAGGDLDRMPSSAYMEDFTNKLDMTCISKGIKPMDEGRVFLGRRAIYSGQSQVEFNIDNHEPKSQDSLSTMLILGSLAGAFLEKCYLDGVDMFSDTLTLHVGLGIALPIEDYLTYKEQYKETLLSSSHHVHVHNFEKPITIEITFDDVQVLAEGAAGQYAIASLGAAFLEKALHVARENGLAIDKAYTGEMLSHARNTIGIDIGEGTTNFPVFQNGNVAIEVSSSINKGYGSVLSTVVNRLRNTPFAFASRKDLADFLLEEELMPNQERLKAKVMTYVEKEIAIFVRDVLKEYANIFRKVGVRTDVVYVYGGGANAMQSYLYPLLSKASILADGMSVPVIYLDSRYSRDLNRNGLFEAAELSEAVQKNKA